MAVKHHGVVRQHEDTARRQLKEYEGTIAGGQVIFLRILDLSETARYMKDMFNVHSCNLFLMKSIDAC